MNHLSPKTKGQAKRVGSLTAAARIAARFAYDALLSCQAGGAARIDDDDLAYFIDVLADDLDRRCTERARSNRTPYEWLRPKK